VKYGHILSYVARQLWAIHPDKLDEILAVLAFRSAGYEFTAEEILARIGPRPEAKPTSYGNSRHAVARIPIRGTIAHHMSAMDEASGGVSTDQISAQFNQALKDDHVGSILLDIDSPGGTIHGVADLADEIRAARGQKPIIAFANDLMASAAYWIGSSADQIVASKTSLVGSIGVITAHQDVSAALEKAGVKVTTISAGKYKGEGSPFEPLSDEAKAAVTDRVNAAYGLFVKGVAQSRGVNVSDVKAGYGEGRALLAADALKAGLIDRIATFEDTLTELLNDSGLKAAMDDQDRRIRLL
jgi:signal peptide peptidase SppA